MCIRDSVYTAPSAVTTAVCDPPADTDTTSRPCGWMAAGREEVSDDVIEWVTTGWMDEVAVSHLWDARHGLKRLRAHPESRASPPVAAVSEPAEVAVTARHHARRHAARQYGPRARRR